MAAADEIKNRIDDVTNLVMVDGLYKIFSHLRDEGGPERIKQLEKVLYHGVPDGNYEIDQLPWDKLNEDDRIFLRGFYEEFMPYWEGFQRLPIARQKEITRITREQLRGGKKP
jgi:hypothetical protein